MCFKKEKDSSKVNYYIRDVPFMTRVDNEWCSIHHMRSHSIRECATNDREDNETNQLVKETLKHKNGYIIHWTCEKKVKVYKLVATCHIRWWIDRKLYKRRD